MANSTSKFLRRGRRFRVHRWCHPSRFGGTALTPQELLLRVFGLIDDEHHASAYPTLS